MTGQPIPRTPDVTSTRRGASRRWRGHLQRLTGALAVLGAALLVAGCTVVIEPVPGAWAPGTTFTRSSTIRQFMPDLGHHATYRVSDTISFLVRTTESGYLTLTAIDPDGSVYVFARNVPVRGGRLEVIDGPGPRQRFVIEPPTGPHRVTAHFTPSRTEERVVYVGLTGYLTWQSQIRLELRSFPYGDVAETRFTVRR